jgi:hypothetical protein
VGAKEHTHEQLETVLGLAEPSAAEARDVLKRPAGPDAGEPTQECQPPDVKHLDHTPEAQRLGQTADGVTARRFVRCPQYGKARLACWLG